MMIYIVKHTFQGHFFGTWNLNCSPFPGQLRQERVMYLKRKPYNLPFESNTKTGRISVMKGSKRVLVKVVLFQLRERGHPQDYATANFLLILNALYKSPQMRYHLFQKFFEKVVEVKEMTFFLRKCLISIAQHCTFSNLYSISF